MLYLVPRTALSEDSERHHSRQTCLGDFVSDTTELESDLLSTRLGRSNNSGALWDVVELGGCDNREDALEMCSIDELVVGRGALQSAHLVASGPTEAHLGLTVVPRHDLDPTGLGLGSPTWGLPLL
jgi:hypothetical protein